MMNTGSVSGEEVGLGKLVRVRYIVHDVDAAIGFYTTMPGFQQVMHPAPEFAILSRGSLHLLLSKPSSRGSGGRPSRANAAGAGWAVIGRPPWPLSWLAGMRPPRTCRQPA